MPLRDFKNFRIDLNSRNKTSENYTPNGVLTGRWEVEFNIQGLNQMDLQDGKKGRWFVAPAYFHLNNVPAGAINYTIEVQLPDFPFLNAWRSMGVSAAATNDGQIDQTLFRIPFTSGVQVEAVVGLGLQPAFDLNCLEIHNPLFLKNGKIRVVITSDDAYAGNLFIPESDSEFNLALSLMWQDVDQGKCPYPPPLDRSANPSNYPPEFSPFPLT